MDRREFFSLAAALGAVSLIPGCSAPVASQPTASPSGNSTAAAGGPLLADFTASLLSGLAPKPTNLIVSPWSIAIALSMIPRRGRRQDRRPVGRPAGRPRPRPG